MTDEKRHESTEITMVCPSSPRVSLAPPSTDDGAVDVERARREAQDANETLVGCPACAGCPCCRGCHMVTVERACEYRRVATLTACVLVDDPEPEAA